MTYNKTPTDFRSSTKFKPSTEEISEYKTSEFVPYVFKPPTEFTPITSTYTYEPKFQSKVINSTFKQYEPKVEDAESTTSFKSAIEFRKSLRTKPDY